MLQIVKSLTDNSIGIIYDHSIFYNTGHKFLLSFTVVKSPLALKWSLVNKTPIKVLSPSILKSSVWVQPLLEPIKNMKKKKFLRQTHVYIF
jgi:hypothetical protein